MLILLGAALFGFGLLLFSLGVAVWLIGLALRIAIRLFQLVLLIVWASVTIYGRLRQRRKVIVLEGEILPPARRAMPDRSRVKRLLLATAMILAAAAAHADAATSAVSCWTYRTQWGTQTKCGNGRGSATCWTSHTRWGDVTKCR
jgi:hypothetical protein